VKKYAVTMICFLLLLGVPGRVPGAEKTVKIATVAVIPFGAMNVEGLTVDVTALVAESLTKLGFDVISQEALEDFLATRRIRRADSLDRAAIREMGVALKVDALMMGFVDILDDPENPRVFIDAQLVDSIDASVVWANSVSRTGADSTTLLGFGGITSMEELIGVAVEQLLKELPRGVDLERSSLPPFEIVRAGFFPDLLRSGEMARLSVEAKEITGKIHEVRAFLLDNEIALTTEDKRLYTGIIKAPPVERTYALTIYVTDEENRLFKTEGAAALTVHNSPPQLVIAFRNRLMSPNDDGVNDNIVFMAEVLKAIPLKGWEVEVIDVEGRVVRSEEGVGHLPEFFIWRGENNQNKPVKDGIYFCRVLVEDQAGNKTVTPGEEIVVDSTMPEAEVVIAGESEEGMTLGLAVQDSSPIVSWELVLDAEGQEPEIFRGQGDVPETLTSSLLKKKT